jgi:hypothetical protein
MSIDPQVQRAYNAIMASFVSEGHAPHYTELARLIDVEVEEARRLQAEALKYGVGAWPLADTDVIESFAPFYNGPTTTRISVDGESKWFAQCFLEGLATPWVFPVKTVPVEALCLERGMTTAVVMRDEEILSVEPETAVGIMNYPMNPELRSGLSGSYF